MQVEVCWHKAETDTPHALVISPAGSLYWLDEKLDQRTTLEIAPFEKPHRVPGISEPLPAT